MTDKPDKPPDPDLADSLDLLSKTPLAAFTPAGKEILNAARESAAEDIGLIDSMDLLAGVLIDQRCQEVLIHSGLAPKTIEKLLAVFFPNRPADQLKVLLAPKRPAPAENS